MARVLIAAAALMALAACSEKPQTNASGVRSDTAAFLGTNMPYVAAGWKQGDKNSWEQQLKTRAHNTQNEYAKSN